MLIMGVYTAGGFSFGPLFSLLLELLAEHASLHGDIVNVDTLPGWGMAVLSVCYFLLVCCFFEAPRSLAALSETNVKADVKPT